MKKFIVPAILLVLAIALFVFLKTDPFEPKLDGTRYLALRSEIDEADMAVFDAAENAELRSSAVKHRDSLWGVLIAMRSLEKPVPAASSAKPISAGKPVPGQIDVPREKPGISSFVYIIGGLILLIIILGGIFLFLRNRQEAYTRQLEKIREDNRFKTPKGGFSDDPTYVGRTRVHRSIIDDGTLSADSPLESKDAGEATGTKIAPGTEDLEFENAKGIVERPTLRPTAKERITSAMQTLSDTLSGLRIPKGVHRDPTANKKFRAQSRNTMQSEAVPDPSPLEVTRFDRERADKEKVLQLNRRGCTNSEIARRTQLSEEQVETVIRVKRETGE